MKKLSKRFPVSSCIVLFLAIVLYLFAFLHYDTVDINKAEVYDVVIEDLEYCSDRQKAWATFNASGMPAYFEFESRGASKSGDFEKLENLANKKTQVKVIFTDYKDLLRLLDFSGRKQVVDIRTENGVIFDCEAFNQYSLIRIIMWSVIATLVLVFGVARFAVYKKLKI